MQGQKLKRTKATSASASAQVTVTTPQTKVFRAAYLFWSFTSINEQLFSHDRPFVNCPRSPKMGLHPQQLDISPVTQSLRLYLVHIIPIEVEDSI